MCSGSLFPRIGKRLLYVESGFDSEANPHIYLLYPQGLDADMKYEDVVTGKVYTGAALMNACLPLPLTTGDYQQIKFTFRAVEK